MIVICYFYQFVKAVCLKMKEVVKPNVIAISLIKVNDKLFQRLLSLFSNPPSFCNW